MFNLFKKKPLLREESIQWIIDSFAWSLENFGSDVFYSETFLVTPSDKYFPDKITNEKYLAKLIFKRVQEYAGMQDWSCELVVQDHDMNPYIAPTVKLANTQQSPAGTFSYSDHDNTKAKITYNPSQVKNPLELIATFAHELAHFLGFTAQNEPPGGSDYWEHATDLLATFMGFGIFLSNSTFSFKQFQDSETQGWSSQSLGYLSQNEHLYTLAIFTVLKDIDPEEVVSHLKKGLIKFYRKAVKDFAENIETIKYLKSIKSSEIAP